MTGLVGPEYWAQDFFFGGLKVTVIFMIMVACDGYVLES